MAREDDKPLVSSIIPIYNVEDYVPSCLASMAAQTYLAMDIVLIDDGSTDGCAELSDLFAMSDSRAIVVHRRNGGLTSSRLTGLKCSHGELVTFVDGDDWVEERYVEECAHAMLENEVDLACCGTRVVYSNHVDESPINCDAGVYNRRELETRVFPYLIEDEWGKRFNMHIWGKMCRRNMLLRAYEGLDLRITIGEDAAVVRPYIFRCSSMAVLDKCLYDYNRQNVYSMTSVRLPMSWENTDRVHERQLQVFADAGELFLAQVRRNYVHNLFVTAVSQFNSGNDYASVSKQIRARLKSPYIRQASKRSGYKSITHRCAAMCVYHRLVFAMWLCWRFVK